MEQAEKIKEIINFYRIKAYKKEIKKANIIKRIKRLVME